MLRARRLLPRIARSLPIKARSARLTGTRWCSDFNGGVPRCSVIARRGAPRRSRLDLSRFARNDQVRKPMNSLSGVPDADPKPFGTLPNAMLENPRQETGDATIHM